MRRWWAVVFVLLFTASAVAQDFEKALNAARAGDYATAWKEWFPLARDGNVTAQYNLGILYENGLGVVRDESTAAMWYRVAAKQGHVTAQYNLGVLYEKGRGVQHDDIEAARWYRKAAEQGFALAQTNLGFLFDHGFGVTRDTGEAVHWYRLEQNRVTRRPSTIWASCTKRAAASRPITPKP